MVTVPILWDPTLVSVTLGGQEQTVVKVNFLNNNNQKMKLKNDGKLHEKNQLIC